jgi:hypothetical protein
MQFKDGRDAEPSTAEIAATIENFADGMSGKWDWDAFISVPYSNERIEAARIACLRVGEDFPGGATQWCNREGLEHLRAIASQLRDSTKY